MQIQNAMKDDSSEQRQRRSYPVAEIAAHLGPPRQPDSTNHVPRSRFIEHANLHPGTGERGRMSPPNLDLELSRELAAKTVRYPTANPRATMKHLNLHKSSVGTPNKDVPQSLARAHWKGGTVLQSPPLQQDPTVGRSTDAQPDCNKSKQQPAQILSKNPPGNIDKVR